jgi:hypothetical protein
VSALLVSSIAEAEGERAKSLIRTGSAQLKIGMSRTADDKYLLPGYSCSLLLLS